MPFIAKAVFLQDPLGKVFTIRLTVVGKHMAIATPRQVRNMMICMLVAAKPTATVNMTNRKLPNTQTSLAPIMSATEPKT